MELYLVIRKPKQKYAGVMNAMLMHIQAKSRTEALRLAVEIEPSFQRVDHDYQKANVQTVTFGAAFYV